MKRVLALALWAAVFQAVIGQPQPGDSAYIPAKDEFLMLDQEARPTNLKAVVQLIQSAAQERSLQAEGRVVIRCLVSPTGTTLQSVVVATPDSRLSNCVLELSSNLLWQPGLINGKPVHAWTSLPIAFKTHVPDTARMQIMIRESPHGTEPMPLNMVEIRRRIEYPKEALQQGISGTVLVKVLVSKEGKVIKSVVLSNPDNSLTSAVIREIKGLRFKPRIIDNQAVDCWITLPFSFQTAP